MKSRSSARSVAIATIGVLAVVLAAWHAIPNAASDFDVYRQGGRVLLHGGSLYADVSVGSLDLPFTYPPFAAVFFLPFALLPAKVALGIWSLLNLAALATISWLTAARIPTIAGVSAPKFATWEIAVGVFIVANLMEPITENFWLGQANLLVVLAIMFDTLHKSRWTGLLTGVAAGFKITPGLFIVFMLVTRRWADAARATAGLGLTVAIGALFGPAQEWRFWTKYLFETNRVGNEDRASDGALAGVLSRVSEASWSHAAWLAIAIAVAIIGLWLARLWWTRARLVSATIVGTTTLLVSPISWIHHWVWMVPLLAVLLGLTVRAWRRDDKAAMWVAAVGTIFVAVPSLVHARRFVYPLLLGQPTAQNITAASYSIGALVGIAALAFLRRSLHTSSDDQRAAQ
ncbi:MAG: glycosyltransferase 87 family protein [Candidatus Nanopelagicales bacterium]